MVDLMRGFTDPASALGSDLSDEVNATRRVLDAARDAARPVFFTAIAYDPQLTDTGPWTLKMPRLSDLVYESPLVEIDARLGRRPDEALVIKKGASAFFGTTLLTLLMAAGCDALVLCGATTGGCVRATAVDAIQHGLPAVVPRQCVGDRTPQWHERNLNDIDAKYADVIDIADALTYLARAGDRSPRYAVAEPTEGPAITPPFGSAGNQRQPTTEGAP